MADEAPELENDAADEVEQEAPEVAETDETEQNEEGEEEEILTFGEEPTEVQETDNATIRHLREELKKARKEAAEVRKSAPQEQAIEIGEKPTLAGCEYDEEAYEKELDAWKERKAKADASKTEAEKARQAEMERWQAQLERVSTEKASLAYADKEDAFDTVSSTLSTAQQAVLVEATDDGNTARMIYALAKNPTLLAEIAAIHNPLKLAAKLAKLEGKLTVTKRKVIEPDTPVRGSAKVSTTPGGTQKQLAKLKAEAEESGDYTKYFELKRKVGA